MLRFPILLAAACGLSAPALLPAQSLTADTEAVSLAQGTEQRLTLSGAGISFDPRTYLVLGSASGTAPGTAAGPLQLPLNLDGYLLFTLQGTNNALLPMATGAVNVAGTATTTFAFPADIPALYGLQLHHAMAIVGPNGPLSETNAVPVTLAEQVLRIDSPTESGSVGSPSLEVSGLLGTTLSGTPGAAATINGSPAALTVDAATGESRFTGTVTLPAASSTLQVIGTNAAGHREVATLGPFVFVPPDANNVQLEGGIAYLALGTAGFGTLDPATGQIAVTSVAGSSVDDLSVADGFLFALDAAGSGALRVYDIASDPFAPQLVSGPVTVPVGPFAGVSAAGGRVVVSGGTGLMTIRNYDVGTGALGSSTSIDLGIGQPDVLLTAGGSQGLVSTDFAGSVGGSGFGITITALNDPPTASTVQSRVGLLGSGFTAGFASPANFPIESALLPGDLFLTAHGGGVSLIDRTTGAIVNTIDPGFAAVNIDTDGSTAAVVGNGRLRLIDYATPTSPALGATQVLGGTLTGVAIDPAFVVIAANAGGVIVQPR